MAILTPSPNNCPNAKKKRVIQLSHEDYEYVTKLINLLQNDDEEERSAALAAIEDILFPKPMVLIKAEPREKPSSYIKKWQASVGARVKTIREEKNLTQKELEALSGIPQPHISRLEKGQHCPSSKTIERIAEALGVDPKLVDPLLED